jgi:hypothetical protein
MSRSFSSWMRRGAICGAALVGVSLVVAAPNAEAAGPYLGLFSDSNYGGCAYYSYDLYPDIADFRAVKYNATGGCTSHANLNDSVSSVTNKVPAGCTITLWTGVNFTGSHQTINSGVFAAHVTYNDQYSSLSTNC